MKILDNLNYISNCVTLVLSEQWFLQIWSRSPHTLPLFHFLRSNQLEVSLNECPLGIPEELGCEPRGGPWTVA